MTTDGRILMSNIEIENSLEIVDAEKVDLEELDVEAPEAIRHAIKSVIRNRELPQMHRDHGSHSNEPH
jgi:hypothetical protein